MTVRILAVCGNGQGSSMIMKMKVDQFLTQSNIDHTVNSCAVGEYKSELSGADIIIASTHIAGEITVTGNKYVVGVRNMLSPADFTQSNIDHTVNSCAVGEYKSELSGADIIIASTHIAGEITVTGNKYVVGVRNMLSPADFGPKLLEVIKEHFPQDVK